MPAYIYFIIAIGLIAIISFYLYSRGKTRKTNSYRPKDFNKRYSNKPLDSKEKKALAYGAILACFNHEEPLSMQLTKREDEFIYGLRNQWNVKEYDSAIQRLNDLIALKKSKEMDRHISNMRDNPEFQKTYERMSRELAIPVNSIKDINSTYAWDISRAISIARWSFWSGYITEEEAWKYINEAASLAQSLGSNWGEYTCSFLLGRILHGYDIDGIVEIAGKLLDKNSEYGYVYHENIFK